MARKFYAYSLRLFLLSFFISANSFAQNPIVTENALQGNAYSEWGVPDFRDSRIAGFSTKISLNSGETVSFKINVEAGAAYTIRIYRIGYYNGNGARLMQNLGSFTGTVQPAGISDPVTGLLDCGNWSVSASWTIPASAVSGLYVAKLERTGGGSNHIIFIVRNDASNADLYLQVPDATWQAYNGFGGNTLYDGNTGFPGGHAVKASYNRPFFPYNSLFNTDGREADWYLNAIYPTIRWLERNGYHVTYTGSNDIGNNGARLLNHKVFISAGHDEYWSKEQRNSVESALNAGVNLIFFGANEVYWKTRWENSDGSEHRTLVCYKEGTMADGTINEQACGNKCDASTNEWTGLWRTGAQYDAGKPENALTGQMSWDGTPGAIQVPDKYRKIRFWRNTNVANLLPGQTATLAPNTLGYEWDYEQFFESYPAGRITMSSTTVNNRTHKLSLYRHASGALVFGTGTVQWAWGLDGEHGSGSPIVSPEMQQATVNVLADMDVQPGTLQTGLTPATKSTDLSAPISQITSPVNGSTIPAGTTVTVTGTASDDGGGVVAGVELSTDGGVTWRQADLTIIDANITWSFTWVPTIEGPATIKSRGFDDSGNKENPGTGTSLTIGPAECPCTIFPAVSTPTNPLNNDGLGGIEVGVKFRADENGFITAIRYYKGAGASGTRTGSLWSGTGTLLAQAIFANETASGWQEVSFLTPVAITAGTTYVASYHSSSGDYASTNPFFSQAVTNGPLRALATGEEGPNGVFQYSSSPVFPAGEFQSNNYWVDVVFIRENLTTAPVVTTHPGSQTICEGEMVSLHSSASGTPAPTVQWQSGDGNTWSNIPGATDDTLSFIAAPTDNNKQYRAVWTNYAGSVNSGGATLTVNAAPGAPAVSVDNNCGNSVLTASAYTGTLLWSTGSSDPSVTVDSAGIYTVTQTLNGCSSTTVSVTAAPEPAPELSGSLTASVNSGELFTYSPASAVAGTTFAWSRAAVNGISNTASTGTGAISETLVSTASAPVNVVYRYTLTANGCTNTQELVVTVNPSSSVPVPDNCVITTSIKSHFNANKIAEGNYIWFSSSMKPGDFKKKRDGETIAIRVTNSWISFKTGLKMHRFKVPDSHIIFDESVTAANAEFINGIWEIKVPRYFDKDIFMGGFAYKVPVDLPGKIRDVKWTSDVTIGKGISFQWRWSAAVYSQFGAHDELDIIVTDGKNEGHHADKGDEGTPENFKAYLVSGAKGKGKDKGKDNYTGDHSSREKVECGKMDDDKDKDRDKKDHPVVKGPRDHKHQLLQWHPDRDEHKYIKVQVSPNPSSNHFRLSFHSKGEGPATILVTDVFGKVMERYERVVPKTLIQVGEKLNTGVYFVTVIQGDQRTTVMIIKTK